MRRFARNQPRRERSIWAILLGLLPGVLFLLIGCSSPFASLPRREDLLEAAHRQSAPGWNVATVNQVHWKAQGDLAIANCSVSLIPAGDVYSVRVVTAARTPPAAVSSTAAQFLPYVIFTDLLPAGSYYQMASRKVVLRQGQGPFPVPWKATFRKDLIDVPEEIRAGNEIRIRLQKKLTWSFIPGEPLLPPPIKPAAAGDAVLAQELVQRIADEQDRRWSSFLTQLQSYDQSYQWGLQGIQAQRRLIDSESWIRNSPAVLNQMLAENQQKSRSLWPSIYGQFKQQLMQAAQTHDAELKSTAHARGIAGSPFN
ncbi:hypothetical protein [Verrucomicrobium sp. 3C]|uniref:hypothetical protein n=1 Tax=Verrucomicrobium sp. 3C TaxID=1134055 RepID=UPI00035FA0D7|nr:hypothetical protein [Verrucomicrobium sp. 3C]